MVFDHSTVIFISKGKRGGGAYKKSLVCKTQIVNVDRNKNVTLNRCPQGIYEYKKKQNKSVQTPF